MLRRHEVEAPLKAGHPKTEVTALGTRRGPVNVRKALCTLASGILAISP
jgi:hypothetical protein